MNGLQSGASEFVTKPFSPKRLVERLRALLEIAAGPADDQGPKISPAQS